MARENGIVDKIEKSNPSEVRGERDLQLPVKALLWRDRGTLLPIEFFRYKRTWKKKPLRIRLIRNRDNCSPAVSLCPQKKRVTKKKNRIFENVKNKKLYHSWTRDTVRWENTSRPSVLHRRSSKRDGRRSIGYENAPKRIFIDGTCVWMSLERADRYPFQPQGRKRRFYKIRMYMYVPQ